MCSNTVRSSKCTLASTGINLAVDAPGNAPGITSTGINLTVDAPGNAAGVASGINLTVDTPGNTYPSGAYP